MSVKGSLESVGLEDLLQADLASQGGGKLTLRHGPHHAALYLAPEGMMVKHPDLMLPDLLLEAFVARGLLDPDAVSRARRSHLHGVRLLDELVREGALPEPEFLEVLAAEVEDTILDMMLWEEGWFRFGREPYVAASMGLLARISVDPRGVARRAMDRLDERRAIGDLLGNHALLFIGSPGVIPPPVDDEDPVLAVPARLDGRTTVHEIALRLGQSRFAVLRAVSRLAEAGMARPAEGIELDVVADEHNEAGRATLARHLILQWVERAPQDPAPLNKLATLAAQMRDTDAELDALCALGHMYVRGGENERALEVFTRAMKKAPADDVVLAGMRVAAEAAGDSDALLDSTLLTAQTKLDEGLVDEALELLAPLRDTYGANMKVHLLYARALVQGEKRAEFFQHAEAVGRVLANEGCHTNVDREAVEYFRETITYLAPDRGDLIERFRSIYDPRSSRHRRLALTLALLVALVGAGVALWPPSASSLLERAQDAANDGDKEQARVYISQLVGRFPDAPEAEEAIALQRMLFPPVDAAPRQKEAVKRLAETLAAKMDGFAAALPRLPDGDAQDTVREVTDLLGVSGAQTIREGILRPHLVELRTAAQRLLTEAMERVDVLGRTGDAHERLKGDTEGMRAFIDEAGRARDPAWLERTRSTAKLLYALTRLHDDTAFQQTTSELIRGVDALDKAAAYHDKCMPTVRLTYAAQQIEEADRRCREEAPKLMVAGQIDRADRIYAHLQTLLQEYATDPLYAPLIERVTRRQLPELIGERRAQIADIRRRINAAKAAEKANDLAEAVRLYADLVETYWLIRFDSVLTLPLYVESVPAGARVLQGGQEVGRTPTIVRYPWGSTGSITVEAPGYTKQEYAVTTRGGTPPSRVRLALAPEAVWKVEVSPSIHFQPLLGDGHVLAVERNVLVTLSDEKTGAIRWSEAHGSLEGVRGRPAYAHGTLFVPNVDGRVLLLSGADGTSVGELLLPRLHGDAASIEDHVALVAADGTVVILKGRSEERRISLGVTPVAGVVAARGAFWIGTIEGGLVRIDARTHERRDIQITANRAAVVGIGVDRDGVYATTAHGSLVALDARGELRWRHDKLGDLVGAPARAGSRVGVATRDGALLCFRAKDGEPAKRFEIGQRPRSGAVGVDDVLLVVREDGSLWACDAMTGLVLVDSTTKADADFPPLVLPGNRVAIPLSGRTLGVVPAPVAPK